MRTCYAETFSGVSESCSHLGLLGKLVRLGTSAEIEDIIVFLNYTGRLLQFSFLRGQHTRCRNHQI